jgi:tRNA (cytidine/uridine-2'-O-)-methyltransferase
MVGAMEKNCQKMMFHIVPYQPEIPANTGNIGRLCLGGMADLHIIKPMRFIINDKYLKRAGLDYWHKLKVYFYDSLEDFYQQHKKARVFYCTTKSKAIYSEQDFEKNDFFMFGPESRGIPEKVLQQNWEQTITIPMTTEVRSLNLANSVAIILYEALRQMNWK